MAIQNGAFPARSDVVKHKGKSVKAWKRISWKVTESTVSTTSLIPAKLSDDNNKRETTLVDSVETVEPTSDVSLNKE